MSRADANSGDSHGSGDGGGDGGRWSASTDSSNLTGAAPSVGRTPPPPPTSRAQPNDGAELAAGDDSNINTSPRSVSTLSAVVQASLIQQEETGNAQNNGDACKFPSGELMDCKNTLQDIPGTSSQPNSPSPQGGGRNIRKVVPNIGDSRDAKNLNAPSLPHLGGNQASLPQVRQDSHGNGDDGSMGLSKTELTEYNGNAVTGGNAAAGTAANTSPAPTQIATATTRETVRRVDFPTQGTLIPVVSARFIADGDAEQAVEAPPLVIKGRFMCLSRRCVVIVVASIALVVLGSILTAVVMMTLPSSSSPSTPLSTNNASNGPIVTAPPTATTATSDPTGSNEGNSPNPSPIQQQQQPPFTYDETLDRSTNVVNFINSVTWKANSDDGATSNQQLRLSNDTTSSAILLEERALEWIVNDDMLQLTPDSRLHQVQLQQRYALATLYVNIFDAASSSSSSATSECQWKGVTCDTTTASIVTKIELGTGSTTNAWVGADSRRSLSVDLALLTSLQSFDVSNSGLTGSIPASLGPAWASSLQIFDVHTNALSGPLPSSIGQWTQLQDFKVHDNALTGNIPSSISMWNRTIKEAAFDTNPGLTGTMPDALCQANTPDLVYLAADEGIPCSCCHCC